MKKRILLVLVSFVLLFLCSCNAMTISGVKWENPKLALTEFIELMTSREFEQAEQMVGNYTSMGFENLETTADSVDKFIFEELLNSYKIEFIGPSFENVSIPYSSDDLIVQGRTATVIFDFTYLSFNALSEELSIKVEEKAAQYAYEGETFDSEEEGFALVKEVFHALMEEKSIDEYYVTKRISTEMYLDGEEWKIELSEEFYSALTGN